jgi:SAM-dependent methyltransferase
MASERSRAVSVNPDRMNAFLGRFVGDLGAVMSMPLVLLGDRLGLYKGLAAAGAEGLSSGQLAERTGTAERYVREWLLNQAASGYVEYDAARGRYWLTPEQTAALADDESPFNVVGGYYVALSMIRDESKMDRPFRLGGGLDWSQHDCNLFCGTERFFAATYRGQLVSQWLPALEGVIDRLTQGAMVADVGCGHGASTILMAQAFPNSRFIGIDSHEPSIACAREHAARAHGNGLAGRIAFEVGASTGFKVHAHGYDLVCFFDCLHDMGDPVGAAAHAREALKPGGTVMIVEPVAGDRVEENLNPVGRVFSAASTMICVPASLAQRGPALGAQAGEARLRQVLSEAGFGSVRVAARTPFNMVLEART